MELKTDKIHRILNTPYDELRPDDFDAAQEQLETLTSKSRGVQTDAWRWLEQQIDALKADHDAQLFNLRSQVSDLTNERERERDAVSSLVIERDQLQGICERLKREIEEAKSDIIAVGITDRRYYLGKQAELRQALREARDHHAADVAEVKRRSDERIKHLEAAVDDLEERLRQAEKEDVKAQKAIDRLCRERDEAIAREQELRAQVQDLTKLAENASVIAVQLTNERDSAQDRERGALRQLAAATEAALENLYRGSRAFADYAARETEAAHRAQNKREAELDAHGYGRAPGTPPAEVVVLGPAGRPDQLQAIRDLPLNERGGPWATSADGKSWWCPDCQASLVPGKLHQCSVSAESSGGLSGVVKVTCGMLTPDGICGEPAVANHGPLDLCSRHLDAIRATDRT